MKCPYCDYSSGWDGETMTDIDGEHGAFTLSVTVLKW